MIGPSYSRIDGHGTDFPEHLLADAKISALEWPTSRATEGTATPLQGRLENRSEAILRGPVAELPYCHVDAPEGRVLAGNQMKSLDVGWLIQRGRI